MNIQRFTAPTSREAMAKARHLFGDSAVILSTRSTEDGFEVMAAAEESLATLASSARAPAGGAGRQRAAATAPAPLAESVEKDTEALSMSTLSFQEYVRERMLRKRRATLQDEATPEAPAPAPAAAPEPRRAPPAPRLAEALPRTPQPLAERGEPHGRGERLDERSLERAGQRLVPEPIRTRPATPVDWDGELPPALPRAGLEPAPGMAAGLDAGADRRLASELSALKDLIEDRFNTLAWLGASKQNPIQSSLMLKLIRAGFSPAMSRAVLERVPGDSGAPEAVRWVMDVLARNLKTASAGAGLCDEGGVVSLIGATGVGKTTTAAKLAAQCVKQHGSGSVGLITLDTYRVSGYEQLRAYGRMLGVVAHLAHDRAALKDLLNLLANKRMVIIDTAGLGQRDQRIQDMLDVLDMPKVKKTLVLNAGAHGDTLDDVLTAFKASQLHGVVLSKVDEAVKLGPALDALIRHQVVLRGVANGQRVPEDWQHADAAALVRVSMGSEGRCAFDPSATDMGFYYSQANCRGIDLGHSHV